MLTAGTTVAGYRIEGIIGEGGMAAVYEAHQASLDRVVALKILARRMGDDADFRERFRRECHIQARFDHPNIVPIYEAGESEYGLWLAMRLVRGPTLREMLLNERLSPEGTLGLLGPIAEALDVAHEHSLIHRDISPQNILVDQRGHPYLADFGITKSRGDRSLTRTGQFVGTLDYVAPEQIQDEPTAVPTDIYSLTAILFECLTGRVPYDKRSEAAVLYAHIAEGPPRATELDPSLPEAIDPVLRRGLAKAPADRYGSATELIEAATEALADRSGASGSEGQSRSAPPAAAEAPAPGKDAAEVVAVDREAATRTGAAPAPPLPAPAARRPAVAGDGAASRAPTRSTGFGHVLRRVALPLSVVVLLGLAAIGVGTASGGDDDDPGTKPAAAGALTIEPSQGWSSRKGGAGIPGLSLADQMTLTPPQRSSEGSVVVGMSSATGKRLLPRRFERTADEPARGVPMSLGALEALRYTGLRSRGTTEPLTVFVSPTSEGVATLVCRPDGRGRLDLPELCSRMAATLKLTDGKGFPLGPSPTLAAALQHQVSMLARRRTVLRRKLAAAGSSAAQADRATALAAAYGRTARALSVPDVTPQSAAGLDRVVGALRSARDAYKDLATAARREQSASYASAVAAVSRSEAAVDRGLLALRRLGYRVAQGAVRGGGR